VNEAPRVTQAKAARPLLWPLVPVYRLGLALHEMQLRMGLKPVRRLRWPVVSIGNLSTGGSGKTPLTIALARALTARGVHVDVLSRGYGRRRKVVVRVAPGGSVDDFGDEPLVSARETGVPVYVAAERYEAGMLAEAEKQGTSEQGNKGTRNTPDTTSQGSVHLLDDGFQHRQLARDVDILLLSRADLNDHLLPTGNLREPLHAAERAQVIAIPADEGDIETEIRSRGWRAEVWRLRRVMEVPPVDGPVVAFCGIAGPGQFFAGLEAAGVQLAARFAFSDHHRYTQSDLARVEDEARKAGATALLTTEKDRVRLGARVKSLAESLPLRTVGLRIEIEDHAEAVDELVSLVLRSG
jgi:tetraacyldisaccharide 4'-kinase